MFRNHGTKTENDMIKIYGIPPAEIRAADKIITMTIYLRTMSNDEKNRTTRIFDQGQIKTYMVKAALFFSRPAYIPIGISILCTTAIARK